MVLKKSFK